MSHIARELKMLFYLNKRYGDYVKIKELADLLEVTERQVRRYRDDLDQCDFLIDSTSGADGGYRLRKRLSRSLMIPDNIMLALNLSAKNNTSLFKELNELPVVSKMKEVVFNSNDITDDELENGTKIINAINKSRMISFVYENNKGKFERTVKPYKVLYTNHSYYLRAVDNTNELKNYDIDKMSDIKESDSFVPDEEVIKKTDEELSYYGIKDSTPVEVVLSYHSDVDIKMIDRVFEYKGIIDKDKRTYTVKSRSMNELFYPIFSLGKKVKIETKIVKDEYMKYLNDQLDALC